MKKFSKYLDTLFAFINSDKILESSNINSTFVGHPLAENIEIDIDKNHYKELLNLDKSDVCIALLPGSRTLRLKVT